MDESTTFKTAPWGKSVRVLTVVSVGILALSSGFCVASAIKFLAFSSIGAAVLFTASTIGPCLLVAVMLMLLAPRGYTVDREHVTVLRKMRRVSVPLASIERLDIVDGHDVFRGSRRSMASGGAFGYFGQFYSPKYKTFQAYVTSLDKVVVISRNNGWTFVVSPDRPEEFVARVEQMRSASAA